MTTATKGPVITATVKDGRMNLSAAQQGAIQTFLRGLEGKPVTVRMERYRRTRSLKNNARYWGPVLGTISAETGHSTEDLHLVYKDMFLPRKFIQLGSREVEIRKTTTDLTDREFSEYVEKVVAHAGTELGIVIDLEQPLT